MMSTAESFAQVRASAIDGRAHNILYRQVQLEHLHKAVLQQRERLEDATVEDTGVSRADAAVELHLALTALKYQYTSLDAGQELKNEYRIAQGKNAPHATRPHGIVYIEPCEHTLAFSVLSPLSAAIAAGNCVVLQLDSTTRYVPTLLRELLTSAISNDILAICNQRPEEALLSQSIQVLQRGTTAIPTHMQLVSHPNERSVAIVDRTAQVDDAARVVVMARFAFGGSSPYAPDIVLVHEFVEKAFLQAAAQQAVSLLATGVSKANSKMRTEGKSYEEILHDIDRQGSAQVVVRGEKGTVINVKQRDSSLLSRKVTDNMLVVHSVTSMDDGIDLANKHGKLLATAVFADGPSAKYVSQFVDTRVTFANHFPAEILVGPATPSNLAVTSKVRYPISAFSVPSPQFITVSEDSKALANTLSGDGLREVDELHDNLQVKYVSRPAGGGIGFFEQGLLTGVGIIATPLLAGIAFGLYYGGRAVALRLLR